MKHYLYGALMGIILALMMFFTIPAEPAVHDPMPWANDGLGCITDSECEGVKS